MYLMSFISLFACETANDPKKLYLVEESQKNILTTFLEGEDLFASMQEEIMVSVDRSTDNLRLIYGKMYEVDSLSGVVISELEKMKRSMFRSFDGLTSKQLSDLVLEKSYKKSNPNTYDLRKVTYVGESELFSGENAQNIPFLYKDFRHKLGDLLITLSTSKSSHPLKPFYDSNISDFKNEQDFSGQFERMVKRNSINSEYVNSLKIIYRKLTKSKQEWSQLLTPSESWIDDFGILLALENEVLTARKIAFEQIKSTVNFCGCYDFSSIEPIVIGPNTAHTGDTIELKMFVAALNQYRNPVVKLKSKGKVIVEKGIAKVQVIVPKSDKFKVSGNLKLMSKSGNILNFNWSHQMEVLQ